MIASTYAGQSIFILPYQPNWEQKVSASFQKLNKIETGLGNREEREELALKLRTTLSYTAMLDTAEAAQLRAAIAIWDNRPILVPFWPSETLLTPTVPPTGNPITDPSGADLTDSSGANLTDSEGSAGFVEVATLGIVPGPGAAIVDSGGAGITDSNGGSLVDTSALGVPGIILTPVPIPIISYAPYGPIAPAVGGGLNIFYEPDWSFYEVSTAAAPVTFTPSVNCLVSPCLWGRFTTKLPEQTVATGQDWETVQFDLTENGAANLSLDPNTVALTYGPSVNGFAVPQLTVPFHWGSNKQQGDVRIKREAVGYGRADADEFYPQTPRSINTLVFQALSNAELTQILHIFRISAGTVWPLWVLPANSNNLANLVYGRFYTEKLTVNWELPARAGELSGCTIEFVTLPTEQAVPIGEVFAETLGPKPPKWFGYQVTDGTATWLYTSYESVIAGPGGNFIPATITHGTIEDEINLQQNDCTLTVQFFEGMPFLRLRNNLNAAQLTVTVWEGYTPNPTAAQMIYTGYCIAPKTTGKKWEIKMRGLASKLDIKGPRLLLQPTCNAAFCDSRCKLTVASVQTTQTLNYVDASGNLSFGATTLGATFTAGKFATGQAIRTIVVNGTAQKQNYMIHDSFVEPDGTLGISLSSPIQPAPSGSEAGWVLVPGCDGQASTCQAYGNFLNFRGFPYVPAQDPSIPPTTTPTGKKG